MKILHIMAGRGLGGAETYAADMMLSLHASGVTQCVVMAADAPRFVELKEAGIRLAPDVLRSRFQPFQKFAVVRLIKQEQPTLIHCWMRRAASLMPRWRQGPVIGWFGGYYDPKHFRRCSHFVGVTPDIVRHMHEHGVAAGRAFYVPTFPDVKPEAPADRASLQTPAHAKVALALSRLHPKKGLDTLLQAAQILPDLYVWLAGDGPLRPDLEKLARDLGVMERVRFLGWRTDRGALLRAANVCVLPSRYEPFGTVILEAWAAGTPLVACASAGPKATISDGVDGMLIPIDASDALAVGLNRVLSDDGLRTRLIANGYAKYIGDYTREAVTRRMLAIYQQLIDIPSAASQS
jgi:glycosyltransferase involved in cell wall biosynthesis